MIGRAWAEPLVCGTSLIPMALDELEKSYSGSTRWRRLCCFTRANGVERTSTAFPRSVFMRYLALAVLLAFAVPARAAVQYDFFDDGFPHAVSASLVLETPMPAGGWTHRDILSLTFTAY